MPRPRTGTKPKHGIAKHAVRSKTSIVIPDREIATLPYSSSMPSNQNLIRSNIRSAPLASRATEGPTFWLLSTEVTTEPNHKQSSSGTAAEKTSVPVTSEATERRIYAPATAERLEATSSIPVTSIKLSSPTHKTITPQAETMPHVTEKPREDEEPKDNEGSVPDNRYSHQNGELEAGEIQVLRSSPTRLRRPPNRFETGELETKPKKKSMFEAISRDSLQRYMVHYNIPKRQDLKKNLVTRVQAHFDTITHEEINLEELAYGVRARLRQLNAEGSKKRKR